MTKVYVKVDRPPEYFPAETESLNVEPLSNGRYRLKNSSIFTPDLAYGDVITAQEDEKGLLWMREVESPGNYSAIRIACLSCELDDFVEALERTTSLGAGYSFHDQYGVAIITIPPHVSYAQVMGALERLPADEVEITRLATRHQSSNA